jgi:hypothetical protein
MLPNTHPDKKVRQKHLEDAIKLVYASTFLRDARSYIERIQYRAEEEKMAVIIQEIVGDVYGDRYYPHFSGVAQSYNYYPTSYMKHSDGLASVALGLGQWVVDGEKTYRFCPRYPDVQILSPEGVLKNSQTAFYALNINAQDFDLTQGGTSTFSRLALKVAEEDGVLWDLASVWDPIDKRIRNGLSYSGPRVITFAHVLKYKRFPLADMLLEILDIGEKALGIPVEIEFAVNLKKNSKEMFPTLYILQIRPFYVYSEGKLIDPKDIHKDELLLYTEQGMGNGIIETISDLIYLDPRKFDNTRTLEMKQEIQSINDRMNAEDREYILIGPGRWGSCDRFLGIPVKWANINKAKVVVETGTENFVVEASQGTHFFHNLVTMNTGYFTIPYNSKKNFVDWKWLRSQKPLTGTEYFTHIRRDTPFIVKMFGKQGVAVIYK